MKFLNEGMKVLRNEGMEEWRNGGMKELSLVHLTLL